MALEYNQSSDGQNEKKLKEKEGYNKAFNSLQDFYDVLSSNEDGMVVYSGSGKPIKLSYRKNQEDYAIEIMSAISEKCPLLIEGPPGTGKSFGYLLPIFYTFQNVDKFDKVIISTSTLQLQQQLLIDIDKVSKMIMPDNKISVSVVKGIRNYACLSKINKIISTTTDGDEREQLRDIVKQMEAKKSADRSDLIDISEKTWEMVKASSRGKCSNCSYASKCYYNINQNLSKKSNIVITNHAYLSHMANTKDDLILNADLFVIDEAHQLEEAIRGTNEKDLNRYDIISIINEIYDKYDDFDEEFPYNKIISSINGVFSSIRKNIRDVAKNNASYAYKEENQEIQIQYGKITKDAIGDVCIKLREFISCVDNFIKFNHMPYDKNIYYLENILDSFEDMKNIASKRKEIYWALFLNENDFVIKHTPRSVLKTMEPIYKSGSPIVLTSATLGARTDNYSYVASGLEIDDILTDMSKADPIDSIYNFKDNSLLYYDSSMPNPSVDRDNLTYFNNQEDRDAYIDRMASEIEELIQITRGKALVLFTSKRDMNDIYAKTLEYHRQLNDDIPIYLQKNSDIEIIKQNFKNSENSCLFATGSFWEGIDISGVSLSNVIICRLPFPVVGPKEHDKGLSFNEKERFRRVYLSKMFQTLEQGVGRLLRSETDTGIVCCLDPRFKNYKNFIIEHDILPIPEENYTESKDDLRAFAESKIYPNESGRVR